MSDAVLFHDFFMDFFAPCIADVLYCAGPMEKCGVVAGSLGDCT